jgi:deoxyribonuclease V
MTIRPLHSWSVTPKEAVALQRKLAEQIELTPPKYSIETIAGCDISFSKRSPILHAAVVVLRISSLEVIESVTATLRVTFPYVPGLLSFREAPALLKAFAKLKHRPDAVMLDGQGIAHPRRFGIACHLGLWLKLPTLGCAKSKLAGECEMPGCEPGERAVLSLRGETVGTVMRTRNRAKPIFISPGHLIDLKTAIKVAIATLDGHRMPLPTRLAHEEANRVRRQYESKS